MLLARYGGSGARSRHAITSAAVTSSYVQQHVRHSHIGSAPLYVPSTLKLSTMPFPPISNPLRIQSAATGNNVSSIRVEGPHGLVMVPLHNFVRMNWQGETAQSSNQETASASATKDTTTESELRMLTISIQNELDKKQRGIWGLTRALLANAIQGVQEGHVVTLRLVGVGYRAAVESDPFPRPDKFEQAFKAITEKAEQRAAQASAGDRIKPTLGSFSSKQQLDFYAALVKQTTAPQRQRLALRLGYSHPIFLPIPRGITCTTPQPTRIVLKGADKESLGAFASSIRKWRPPEPYKGKGVFVGDETIKLKAVRKK